MKKLFLLLALSLLFCTLSVCAYVEIDLTDADVAKTFAKVGSSSVVPDRGVKMGNGVSGINIKQIITNQPNNKMVYLEFDNEVISEDSSVLFYVDYTYGDRVSKAEYAQYGVNISSGKLTVTYAPELMANGKPIKSPTNLELYTVADAGEYIILKKIYLFDSVSDYNTYFADIDETVLGAQKRDGENPGLRFAARIDYTDLVPSIDAIRYSGEDDDAYAGWLVIPTDDLGDVDLKHENRPHIAGFVADIKAKNIFSFDANGSVFTAVITNFFSDTAKNASITARPYLYINGEYYYLAPVAATYAAAELDFQK